jgi:hypothetical protein
LLSNPTDKNICVADACSLLFSAQIRLKGQSVFDWLLNKYDVYICSTVKYECLDKIQRNRVVIPDTVSFKRDLAMRTSTLDCVECLRYLEAFCEEMGISKFLSLDEGEKHSIALALLLSVTLKKPVSILTDDFEAVEVFNEILNEQKFGIVQSLPDFIINVFKLNPAVDENITNGALQSYYNIMTKAILSITFKKRMRLSCRSLWFDKCGMRCQ